MASQPLLAGAIAFAAVVLSMVPEEHLLEAHEQRESPGTTATLFVGFLPFLGITVLVG